MNILIVGAHGMLGKDLAETLKTKHTLLLSSRNNLDITDLKSCRDYISQAKPDLIINCAAYTQVDKCEEEIELAYKVNALGPRNLAVISNEQNIPLVQISTDYVFDGTKGTNYLEDDTKNPLSIYGKSKSLAEDYIMALLNKFYIIRTSWLFGEHGNNFIKTMLQIGKTRDSLAVVNDQFGSPTYTRDLAQAIADLIEETRYGIYHITNSGYTNWYEYTKDIFTLSGYNVTVRPISTEEFNRPAPRPKYSVLNNRLWQLEGFTPLRPYQEAVKEYIENYLKKEVQP
ncbi:dTDP-4-dehydrorhamnose reductase [Desulforamulus aeronauticus]|uniref:dTDP-4-dehydrorhamnose reductase n=1 Tax=Desulforamulus aeronauticus DSM 10349 TaxID=1121421 RepID=A0A1M6T4D6_9FIRM|nr:dTDP-4-dehydrorhamnose reductase [Desulforamulus aeronauticus]SHK51807.1 dTDP-4-dehydrorhamnose reductase [Desulforamulus aeronauticus DSM 10349]